MYHEIFGQRCQDKVGELVMATISVIIGTFGNNYWI